MFHTVFQYIAKISPRAMEINWLYYFLHEKFTIRKASNRNNAFRSTDFGNIKVANAHRNLSNRNKIKLLIIQLLVDENFTITF